MGCNEDVVGTKRAIPEGVVCRDKLNSRGCKRASVTNGGEAINGTEIAGNINRDEKEISFVRVECSQIIGVHQGFVNGNLGCKQVVVASLVRKPGFVVFRW